MLRVRGFLSCSFVPPQKEEAQAQAQQFSNEGGGPDHGAGAQEVEDHEGGRQQEEPAAQGETILGYLLIKDGDGEVMWMDVLAAWPKGTGVGRMLMDHCEAFLRARGKTECRLYTHVKYQRTLEIYRQRGYVIYDRVQEKGFDRYYMRKQLK